MVAMTEDEKKRLEEILSDTGDLMEKVRECIVSLLRMVRFNVKCCLSISCCDFLAS